jgi:chemotaxis protein methyltransferase CheR
LISITEKEFNKLADYIKSNYGIYLRKEKMALVNGRLNSVLEQAGFSNFTDYFNFVLEDKSGSACITLIDRITTNHTFFMREPDHFFFFRDVVLPDLVNTVNNRDIRIWCAACSTGQESYTLAMLIDEFFGSSKEGWDTKVLATDISGKALEFAKNGIYSNEMTAPLPAAWKLNYFVKTDKEHSMVCEKIRKEVIYRKLNLMDSSFPFKKKLHVIFCRNVMIYFDSNTKNELAERFYDNLEVGGYLFIGHSESLNRESSRFKYVRPSVYRKI